MKSAVSLALLLFLLGQVCQAQEDKVDQYRFFYPLDEWKLTESQEKDFHQWLNQLDRSNIYGIIIKSYCDEWGSNGHNDSLSAQRAKEVRRAFIANGLDSNLIKECTGMGELSLPAHKDPENTRKQHRRTDVFVYYPLKKNPPPPPAPVPPAPAKKEVEIKKEEKVLGIALDSLTVGDKVILQNILFQGGRHYLLPESEQTLNDLIEILKNNPHIYFDIQGHVCCTPGGYDGYDTDTQKRNLSYARAQQIYNLLAKAGIDKDRMTYHGFGGNFPLGGDPKFDRRVEIEITRMDK